MSILLRQGFSKYYRILASDLDEPVRSTTGRATHIPSHIVTPASKLQFVVSTRRQGVNVD